MSGTVESPPLDWRAISQRMLEANPVFIAGCNRSGTTALRLTLDRHPAFRSRAPASPETRVFVHPRRVLRILEPQGERLMRFLLGDEQVARRMMEVLGPHENWREPGDRVHLLRVFFYFAQQARGCSRLLEKSPGHVFHLDRLFEAFPGARVILTIRHPVDVLSSLRKRRQRSAQSGRLLRERSWQLFPAEEMASAWARIGRIERERRQADPERCFVLRYEDLTADAEGRLRALCQFLGEPFEAGALIEEVEVQRDVHGSPNKAGRITANEKAWREFLGPEEARELEDRLELEMKSFGYARYT